MKAGIDKKEIPNLNNDRHFSLADRLVSEFDTGLRTLFGKPEITERENPANKIAESELSEEQQRHAAGLMRVNHAGEVCAQALYQGQALTARDPEVARQMHRSALEENDHLDWCASRCKELGTHTSVLGPFWYVGSLTIGAIAGVAGDKWSLGFVAETEHQVVRHLDSHLAQIPEKDKKTRAILEQMKEDESHHATVALHAGGAELPMPVKTFMGLTSKIMTKAAYWV